jgi:hypothetical protein
LTLPDRRSRVASLVGAKQVPAGAKKIRAFVEGIATHGTAPLSSSVTWRTVLLKLETGNWKLTENRHGPAEERVKNSRLCSVRL